MLKRIALVFGAVLLIIGIVGFIPGVTTFMPDSNEGMFLGALAVDGVHNGLHILTGLAALAAGFTSEAVSRSFFKVFGVVYGIVALLGFGYGNAPVLGVMANNLADAAVHTVIATAALLLGFGHLLERFEHHGDEGTHHPA